MQLLAGGDDTLDAALVDAEQYAEAVQVNQRAVEACRALGDTVRLQLATNHHDKALRGLSQISPSGWRVLRRGCRADSILMSSDRTSGQAVASAG